MAGLNPFTFLNSINSDKKDLMKDDPIAVKQYNAFMVNRGLSYFPDTILAANEMNINHHLDNDQQYYFLINIVSKRKRFSKWHKTTKDADLEIVKEYYGYSDQRALEALRILEPDQINTLKQKLYKGGIK